MLLETTPNSSVNPRSLRATRAPRVRCVDECPKPRRIVHDKWQQASIGRAAARSLPGLAATSGSGARNSVAAGHTSTYLEAVWARGSCDQRRGFVCALSSQTHVVHILANTVRDSYRAFRSSSALC